ncbi:MAG: C-type lectin domain-containing protein [Candidatus Hydrogenedentes bacterium]|nr:C-type lectin domain-containing protein [Candidatus Hydrogenedentota bacterium]
MRKLSLLVILAGVVCTLPSAVFANSQIIDFSCIMLYQPVCYDCFILHAEDDDFTRQGGLGILDMEEMELLSLILADPAALHHDEIHSAFTTNAGLARTCIGPTMLTFTTPTATSGETARQPIPNTDPQIYYGADATMGAYITMGEWDLYVATLEGYKYSPFGAGTVVPTSDEGYVLLQELSTCGDVDDDGVSNCYEYWAASPYSFAGAIDPEVTDAACAWNVWACSDAPASNLKFAWNAATGRVYLMPGAEMTWAEATGLSVIDYAGRVPISVALVTIRNYEEKSFVDSLMEDGSYVWIGCTDAGRDIGHTAPNPQDWYWLSDPSQGQMTYTAWQAGQPNGVDGAEDCGVMRGSLDGGFKGEMPAIWYDVSEFTGSPPEPRLYPAIFELPDLYPDEDSNGAPDAFEDKDGDLVPDGPFVEPGEGEGEGPGEGEGEGECDEVPFGCFRNT